MIRFLRLPVVSLLKALSAPLGNEEIFSYYKPWLLSRDSWTFMNPKGLFQPAFFIEAILENQVLSSDFQDVMVRIDISGCFGAECPWIRSLKSIFTPQGFNRSPLKIGRNQPKKEVGSSSKHDGFQRTVKLSISGRV